MIIKETNFPIYWTFISVSIIISLGYILFSMSDTIDKKIKIPIFSFLYLFCIIVFGTIFSMITSIPKMNLSLSSFGCAFGILINLYITNRIIQDKKLKIYSIISLPLTYGIAKIGCFLAGCCYGIPYKGIISVTYANGLNKPVFPIQIIESIIFLLIFIIVNKKKDNKNIINITILTCAIAKFILDFFRYDHVYKIITLNQMLCIFIIIVVLYQIIRKKEII